MKRWYQSNGGILAVFLLLILAGISITGWSSKRWGLVVIGVGVLTIPINAIVVGLRRVWRRRHPALVAPKPREIASDAHRDRLRKYLATVRECVGMGRPVQLTGEMRDILEAHYPEVVDGFQRWRSVAQARLDAPKALEERFSRTLWAKSLSEPDRFDRRTIAAFFSALTASRMLNGLQDTSMSHEQMWDVFGPAASGPPDGVHPKRHGAIVIAMKDVPDDEYKDKSLALIEEVEPVFWEGQSWPEAWAIRDAEQRLNDYDTDPLTSLIQRLELPERVYVANGCPVCHEVA